ncbi:hypothetical protein EJ110_NYTH10999 [Nymphaea thermarum]|nr:hypothetical protein EJ110_NYTH10999 [Nymphaea thermarum]
MRRLGALSAWRGLAQMGRRGRRHADIDNMTAAFQVPVEENNPAADGAVQRRDEGEGMKG